jgi:predicted ABC-type ATPase
VSTPTIYLIGGCNGAGKTTFASRFLPTELKCLRFLNADEISRGLSPFDPSAAALRAGRILLEQFRTHVDRRESFTLESTLSGKTYVKLLREAIHSGFQLELHYLVLADAETAVQRVRARVQMGGHNVPEIDIRRRFTRSRENLVAAYLPMATRWIIWSAGTLQPECLASSASHDMDDVRKLIL